MDTRSLDYRTPASVLVEVAKIAAPYRGQQHRLGKVTTEVSSLVPVLSYDVVNVIAREMDLDVSTVYSFITFYAMLSTRPHAFALLESAWESLSKSPASRRPATTVISA